MLGTNDPQVRYGLAPAAIVEDVLGLALIAARSGCGPGGTRPRTVVVAPPPLREIPNPLQAAAFGPGAAEMSREVARLLSAAGDVVAAASEIFDGGAIAQFSAADGIHLDAAGHEALGRALARVVAP